MAPDVPNAAAASIALLQGSGPKPLMRWGSAEPRVSAPIRIPIARPRSADSDHEAISFIPTGYTPARNIPVRNLIGTAAPRPVAKKAIAAVHAAAPSALAASSFCGVTRSARLKTAEVIAPVTNPICTEAVSQTAAVASIPHSARRVGTTAVAENQTLRPKHLDKRDERALLVGPRQRHRRIPFRRRGFGRVRAARRLRAALLRSARVGACAIPPGPSCSSRCAR